jgi:hypothetical protein
MFTQHASPDLQKLAHEVGIRTVVSKMDAFPVAGIIEALLGSDDSYGSAPNLGLGRWLGLQGETADGNGGSGTETEYVQDLDQGRKQKARKLLTVSRVNSNQAYCRGCPPEVVQGDASAAAPPRITPLSSMQ